MTPLADEVLAAIRAHAAETYPHECCGLVVVRQGRAVYHPCANVSAHPVQEFVIAPEDYASAEDECEIVRIVHSHVHLPPEPSAGDLVACEASGLPWLIVSWPTGRMHEFEPSGYEAPLVGRPFHHGVLDCYSLKRDHFRREVGIDLPDFPRRPNWWLAGVALVAAAFVTGGASIGAAAEGEAGILGSGYTFTSTTLGGMALSFGSTLILGGLSQMLAQNPAKPGSSIGGGISPSL